MKKSFRFAALAASAVLTFGSVAMFAGCDTSTPEVTFTFGFHGEEYKVSFELTRKEAPQTVQHFIELINAHYYDNTVIHDYASGQLHGGGYVLDENEDSGLREKDYWTELKKYEAEHNYKFTQTVFENKDNDSFDPDKDGLYTLHGEFTKNGVELEKASDDVFKQNRLGTLVMYYSDKGPNSDSALVRTLRSDNGKNNDGNLYNTNAQYTYNSATSLFYVTTNATSMNGTPDSNYCAFGRVKDREELNELLDAIEEYISELAELDEVFAEEKTVILNQFDPFSLIQSARIPATFLVPVEPIIIKSVKVDKY